MEKKKRKRMTAGQMFAIADLMQRCNQKFKTRVDIARWVSSQIGEDFAESQVTNVILERKMDISCFLETPPPPRKRSETTERLHALETQLAELTETVEQLRTTVNLIAGRLPAQSKPVLFGES